MNNTSRKFVSKWIETQKSALGLSSKSVMRKKLVCTKMINVANTKCSFKKNRVILLEVSVKTLFIELCELMSTINSKY